jgi:hypothetical protein
VTTQQQIDELLKLTQDDAVKSQQAWRALLWFERLGLVIASSGASTARKYADLLKARDLLANRLRNILQPVTDDDVTGVVVVVDESSSSPRPTGSADQG